MSVDMIQPPRLLVTTTAAPLEVMAAASVAAAEASDVFSAHVREESSGPDRVDYSVTPPLAHEPALRLHVTWVESLDRTGPRLSVSVDVSVVDATACGDRARRTDRAVDRFTGLLARHLTR